MPACACTAWNGSPSWSCAAGWTRWRASGPPSWPPSRRAWKGGSGGDERDAVSHRRGPGAGGGAGSGGARGGVPGVHGGDQRVVADGAAVPGGREKSEWDSSRAAGGGGGGAGRVRVWEPPARLVFEWRAVNFAPEEKTEVEVTFEARTGGT